MGLYDTLGEMTQKQILKTENGDNRILGAVIGTVTNNYAKEMPGRVCVSIPTRDKDHNELKWARVAMPSSGAQWGHYFLPEIGDQVLIVFEQGNIEKPYIVGCIPKDKNKFLTGSVDEKNQYKKITTRHGSTITFTDNAEEDGAKGEKDKIEIITAGKQHSIKLDNEGKEIVIKDKDGKNKFQIWTEDDNGRIEIRCDKKLQIKVGDDISLTMTGDNGNVELSAKSFKVKVDNIELESNSNFKTNAANIVMEGSSNVKISGGPVSVSGSPIKLG